ncbi:MAG: YqaA family protein [Candidatus Aenigmatarchaeota archaeon]
MSLIESMLEWSRLALLPLGEAGLFVVAFTESSFSPIPVELLLIPMALAKPELALWFAFIATFASVAGAVLGHWIGLKGGRPLLRKLVSDHKVNRAEHYFNKYGSMAVFIGAFTPIPYKIFTITAGMLKFRLYKTIIASIAGRTPRFFAEAIVIMLWGEAIVAFLSEYFEIVTLGLGAAVIGAYIIYKKLKKSRPLAHKRR